jgi:hypothetical protein
LVDNLITIIARARKDTLDETELQDVERKMARRQADNQKEEAARQERGTKELVSHYHFIKSVSAE